MYEPIIDEVYRKENANIYRININKLTREENARFRTYYAYKSTPTIFVVKDGVVTKENTEITEKNSLIKWVKENL